MTGLSIVMMGSWQDGSLEGIAVTTDAFQKGLFFMPGQVAAFILMICLVFFAFTTILGWDYYGERCLEYLTNGSKVYIQRTYGDSEYHSIACTQQCGCGRDKGLLCTPQGTVGFNRSKCLYVIIGEAPISSQAKFCLAAFF